jgi:hypothetical protein
MSSWPHRWRKHASHVGCRLLPAKRTPYQTQEDPAGSAWFLRARFGGPVRCWTYKVQIAANACTNPVAMACRVGGEKEIVRLCGSSTSVWWLASVHWSTGGIGAQCRGGARKLQPGHHLGRLGPRRRPPDTFLPRRRVLSSLLPPHAREQPSAAAAKAVATAMCRYSDTRARQLQQTVVADRVYCGVALAAFLPHCPWCLSLGHEPVQRTTWDQVEWGSPRLLGLLIGGRRRRMGTITTLWPRVKKKGEGHRILDEGLR